MLVIAIKYATMQGFRIPKHNEIAIQLQQDCSRKIPKDLWMATSARSFLELLSQPNLFYTININIFPLKCEPVWKKSDCYKINCAMKTWKLLWNDKNVNKIFQRWISNASKNLNLNQFYFYKWMSRVNPVFSHFFCSIFKVTISMKKLK